MVRAVGIVPAVLDRDPLPPPPRHGPRREEIHDFADMDYKIVDGGADPTMTGREQPRPITDRYAPNQ